MPWYSVMDKTNPNRAGDHGEDNMKETCAETAAAAAARPPSLAAGADVKLDRAPIDLRRPGSSLQRGARSSSTTA
jgi:hypothetical protein